MLYYTTAFLISCYYDILGRVLPSISPSGRLWRRDRVARFTFEATCGTGLDLIEALQMQPG